MAGLCEGGNEPSGSLKAIYENTGGEGCDPVLWIELRRSSMVRALDLKIRWRDQVRLDLERVAGNEDNHKTEQKGGRLTTSSQFTVLLSQSLEFTVSRTTDLQRQFTVLELGSLQLRSTALELRSLQLRSTALELRPSDADADADAHSSRTPAGLLALAFSLTE
ncbi:hypothetical protein ANN_06989 [Periplaneta americana]|uniref:Uncharacterized protein n=1 Tax=Periplaneta americana TaxID=6978 RepID=A0ABQ8TH27_PERAM|nr:hypothetical protein ANN_06989 [Periplaneta americana]